MPNPFLSVPAPNSGLHLPKIAYIGPPPHPTPPGLASLFTYTQPRPSAEIRNIWGSYMLHEAHGHDGASGKCICWSLVVVASKVSAGAQGNQALTHQYADSGYLQYGSPCPTTFAAAHEINMQQGSPFHVTKPNTLSLAFRLYVSTNYVSISAVDNVQRRPKAVSNWTILEYEVCAWT